MSDQQIIDKIKENQQLRMLQSEIIVIAVLLGLFINIFSSIIYDQILSRYSNNPLIVLGLAVIIIGITIYFSKHFFSSDSRIQIYHFSHDILSAGLYQSNIDGEIRKKFIEFGLTKNEFQILLDQFEQAFRKLLAYDNINILPNQGISAIKRKEDESIIEFDISQNGVNAQLDVRFYSEPNLSFLSKDYEEKGDFYNVYLNVDGFINNSRHKNSLLFYEEFSPKGIWGIEPIKSLFPLILGHYWGLIDQRSLFYHLVSYFELDKTNKN